MAEVKRSLAAKGGMPDPGRFSLFSLLFFSLLFFCLLFLSLRTNNTTHDSLVLLWKYNHNTHLLPWLPFPVRRCQHRGLALHAGEGCSSKAAVGVGVGMLGCWDDGMTCAGGSLLIPRM